MALGAPQDGHVQVADDGTGKKIDNTALTREPTTQGGTGETVYRQRVVVSSDENPRQQMEISGEAGKGKANVEDKSQDVLEVLMEIRDLLKMVIGA